MLDHNLAPRLAIALQAIFVQHEIVALRNKFPANTADRNWMDALSASGGWAVLTRDLHLRTRPHERAALDRSRIVFFFLAGAWKKYGVEDQAWRLIRLVPLMAKQTEIADRGRFELPINVASKLRPHRD